MGECNSHLRVIEGRPWKQAMICALNPDAPYQPWHGAEAVDYGDTVVVVIDTEPRTALCAFTYSPMLDIRHTIMAESRFDRRSMPTVHEVESELGYSLTERNGRPLRKAAAEKLFQAVHWRLAEGSGGRIGDTSVAAARIMAYSAGSCTCCREEVELPDEQAADRLVHTVAAEDMGRDWPALLCTDCEAEMREAGLSSVVDLVFSRRPVCPSCGARRARTIGFGMPSYEWRMNITPWQSMGGCVVKSPSPTWCCGACGHEWA